MEPVIARPFWHVGVCAAGRSKIEDRARSIPPILDSFRGELQL